MSISRRDFLLFMGAATSMAACNASANRPYRSSAATESTISFKPVRVPIPLNIEGLSPEQQKQAYSTYQVIDDLVLPEGYVYETIAAWGDPVGNSRFGYNNDFVSFVETAPNSGYLSINFEYISGKTWMQTYDQVLGKSLPFDQVRSAMGQEKIDAFALPTDNPLKQQIEAIAKEGLIDQGIGVIAVQAQKGKWVRQPSAQDRRITGISGLEDGRYLKATGPGVAVFTKTNKRGYDDNLGNRIIGTFQNCAGGDHAMGDHLVRRRKLPRPSPRTRDGGWLLFSPFPYPV